MQEYNGNNLLLTLFISSISLQLKYDSADCCCGRLIGPDNFGPKRPSRPRLKNQLSPTPNRVDPFVTQCWAKTTNLTQTLGHKMTNRFFQTCNKASLIYPGSGPEVEQFIGIGPITL